MWRRWRAARAFDEELSGVGCVIFDELHFLSDPERGPVWEEAIIHSPAHVIFVGLSATVSNADELRRWIERVHGPMALVYHDERAVPLEHYFFFEGKLRLVAERRWAARRALPRHRRRGQAGAHAATAGGATPSATTRRASSRHASPAKARWRPTWTAPDAANANAPAGRASRRCRRSVPRRSRARC